MKDTYHSDTTILTAFPHWTLALTLKSYLFALTRTVKARREARRGQRERERETGRGKGSGGVRVVRLGWWW